MFSLVCVSACVREINEYYQPSLATLAARLPLEDLTFSWEKKIATEQYSKFHFNKSH